MTGFPVTITDHLCNALRQIAVEFNGDCSLMSSDKNQLSAL